MTENVIHKNGVYDFNVTTQEDKPLQKICFFIRKILAEQLDLFLI